MIKSDKLVVVKAALYFCINCLGLFVALGLQTSGASTASASRNNTNVPVATPINTDSAGKARGVAHKSVVRVVCPKENWAGTGFVHKSGKVITAQHVIQPCSGIFIVPSEGPPIAASALASDEDLDIALLAPDFRIAETGLPISTRADLVVGAQVSTWGFPAGYPGREPLLSVGYLAGTSPVKGPSAGSITQQWVVNAAFNGGNSGGPLLDIETGNWGGGEQACADFVERGERAWGAQRPTIRIHVYGNSPRWIKTQYLGGTVSRIGARGASKSDSTSDWHGCTRG